MNSGLQAGHLEDSPSGRFTLMIEAPLVPTPGGAYVVTLTDKATGQLLRINSIQLDSEQKTKSIRGLPVSMVWDATESTADIIIDGEFLVRISTPVTSGPMETKASNHPYPRGMVESS